MDHPDRRPELGVKIKLDSKGKPYYFADSLWLTIFTFLTDKITGAVKRETGINPTQLRILLELHFSKRPERIKDLSEELMIRENTTVAAVNKLEGSGLISRRPDESDLRATLVELTDKGDEMVQSIFDVFEKLREKKPDIFSDEHINAVIEVSEAFLDLEENGYHDADGKLMLIPTCLEMIATVLTRFLVAARKYNITFTQMHVLSVLYHADKPLRVSSVSNNTQLPLNVVTITVNNLYDDGFVERESDPRPTHARSCSRLLRRAWRYMRRSSPFLIDSKQGPESYRFSRPRNSRVTSAATSKVRAKQDAPVAFTPEFARLAARIVK